jgi:Fe-S-cluster containining protein
MSAKISKTLRLDNASCGDLCQSQSFLSMAATGSSLRHIRYEAVSISARRVTIGASGDATIDDLFIIGVSCARYTDRIGAEKVQGRSNRLVSRFARLPPLAYEETMAKTSAKKPRVNYDCSNCPGYCCCYPEIPTNERDVRRLARHFDLTPDQARRRFTKKTDDGKRRSLRHKDDDYFEQRCMFLHPDERRCTIYEARPTICRQYPGNAKCNYYDFLCAERRAQDDPDLVVEVRF